MKLLKPVALALTCALLLAGLNGQTRGVIADNQKYFEQQQLRLMVAEVTANPQLKETIEGYEVLDEGNLVALITRVSTSKGYNGDISLLVARTPDSKVLSVRTTSHQETPGIGDKIDINISDWMTQFRGRTPESDFSLVPDGDIDGITGATITSRAVSQAVSEALTP